MGRELATKLALTAALLGCRTRKDLCQRFREVNPLTSFDLERSQKWLQGRSLPRSARVYDDWVLLLGLDRPATWLGDCTAAAFLAEVCSKFDVEAADLQRRADLFGSRPASGDAGFAQYLHGEYVAYSNSWGPYDFGLLVRGMMRIGAGKGRMLDVTYGETVAERTILWRGSARLGARALQIDLHEPDTDSPLTLTLFKPSLPASVLVGLMCGTCLLGANGLPTSTRVALVKLAAEGGPTLRAWEAHLDRAAEAIDGDLARLGLGGADVGAIVMRFLDGSAGNVIDQVGAEATAELTAAFDQVRLTRPAASRFATVPGGPLRPAFVASRK